MSLVLEEKEIKSNQQGTPSVEVDALAATHVVSTILSPTPITLVLIHPTVRTSSWLDMATATTLRPATMPPPRVSPLADSRAGL